MHGNTGSKASMLQRIGLFLLLVICGSTQASTVLEMSFEDVVDHSELVFEGQVLDLEARQLDDGSIQTFVRFAVREVIKGVYPDGEIELRFLGGRVGNRALEVADMHMPEVGESGIYFVESLSRFQVHPLVGWAQGHFLLEVQAAGAQIVTTADHSPVMAIDADAVPETAALSTFSKGVAKGVVVDNGQGQLAPLSQPMNAIEFKQSVRDIAARVQ